ncbi:hypothetical protein ACQCX5_14615 [Propionibacteriaceae bacterium G57]|uniref:hypothetical protein n=1 Tax=Aestuariimicrobium sp. G57 TaxID=3418485 RepID=UPI003DA75E4D
MSGPAPTPWRGLVGAASLDVPVPIGTPMSGYAARTSPSTGTADPMTVRALVVDRVALVAVDCCALHERTCESIRTRLLDDGVVDEVVVAATHTHAGACITPGRLGRESPEVRTAAGRTAIRAVLMAAGGVVPARASHGEQHGAGIAHNRRHLDRPIDPPVQVLAFDDASDRRIATLVTHPCHPVVLDASNTLVSADFVAALRDQVEAAHPGSTCIFMTGAAGDVNDGHPPRPRSPRRGPARGPSMMPNASDERWAPRPSMPHSNPSWVTTGPQPPTTRWCWPSSPSTVRPSPPTSPRGDSA